ncbi:MAG TPA: uroporphyrinogen-III C-methyltransferase [Bacillota bacterium]|nr:uroporphyrinogen-III C-methyltransferase [Peptococcaceae bacterium MAG4]HPU35566.1 uroporphyrinogen-III C-methyltransferase [Bacillota bacterium]HPZ42625.1 uroporphyrinogen-III C-methyltransferase [Bacillota bacterium]HQD75628.1 uroporphyrinogen-III C-methyltransferase [Bacillota bacterium]HUM59464.1 uroporphyrinogen-III C-methyltransferase [Bacillota bacterium]
MIAVAKGIVYLVGAGPGNPGLITVKGAELLRKADVIVYDRLAGHRLMSLARPGAEVIYVGKSPDCHTLKQAEINSLLIAKAREGKLVVRLKGGDPFVFGRGGEEAEALVEAGIEFEVVPGVTSAIAVPAYAGIPVTHRSFTSTLAVITGNEDPTKKNPDIAWDKIATGAGTLVFLMGMANLPAIVRRLVENGRSPQTPVALVRQGAGPEQQTLTGTLEDICEKAKNAEFKNPAVIIVGDVVYLREKLNWFEKKPLFGKRVLVTRSREQASALSAAIEEAGGEALEFPVIRVVEPEDYGPLDRAINNLKTFDWVIFTSVNGVQAFFRRLRHLRKDIRELYRARLCAIGPKTGEALENYGLLVETVPEKYRAEEIIEALRDRIEAGTKILLPRADIARKVLPEALRQVGAEVTEVTAYRTVAGDGDSSRIREMLARGEIHLVTFTSSSTVRNLVNMLNAPDLQTLLKNVVVACIGPITAGTARELGLKVDVVAKEYTIEGLVRSLLEYYSLQTV